MPIRTAAVVLAAALGVLAVLAAPSAAQVPQPPPGLPDDLDDLLDDGPTARFKVTVNGFQESQIDFVFNSALALPCALQATGTLSERWTFDRGKDVVLVFRKLGPGVVFVSRVGRQPGDTAFAAPGTVSRRATGAARQQFPDGSCRAFPLHAGDCGTEFPVRTNFSFGWSKGKLTVAQSSTENQRVNPARACGTTPVGNFDVITNQFPFLLKQRDALKPKQIFGSRRNFSLMLEPRFLEPIEPPGYIKLEETLTAMSHVTLTRKK